MVDQKDYYEYWNQKRAGKSIPLLHREKIALNLIKETKINQGILVDLGCGNGDFLKKVKRKFGSLDLKGFDFSRREVEEARKNGFDVSWADFEKEIPLGSKKVDIVYAGEVIEHLYNPDAFLDNCNKIIKKGSYLIISTPNLAAWFNRILLVFGIQPIFLEPSTKSKLIGAGILARFKKDATPVGHVRIFTYRALKDLFEANGFEIVTTKGAIFDEGFPKPILLIDSIFSHFPRLSANFVMLAKKVK